MVSRTTYSIYVHLLVYLTNTVAFEKQFQISENELPCLSAVYKKMNCVACLSLTSPTVSVSETQIKANQKHHKNKEYVNMSATCQTWLLHVLPNFMSPAEQTVIAHSRVKINEFLRQAEKKRSSSCIRINWNVTF